MSEIILTQPDPTEHERGGLSAVEIAKEATIESNDDREFAAPIVEELRMIIKAIDTEFDGTEKDPGPTKLAHRAHAAMCATRDKARAGFVEAKRIWDAKLKKFEFDVQQKRQIEAKKALAKAEEKATLEREERIREAEKLGDHDAVEHLSDAPLNVTIAPLKTEPVTKVQGLRASSPMWAWEPIDLNKIPREYWTVDEKKVSGVVKSLGDKANIPGISVFDARGRS